ncbi:hypothetical protein [Limobrevibacterium gyesilva]|uniref:Uncharacterized protein n=1 Tax=Limobrevibacterium gyesilva TaxID=2991712 RepID=A0AA41YMQ2_9PROT|nr:hypothetical protein [Limobrevibacterium gyesilva]MCW3476744.1 hypothetical protein [Limobrevibacterium gyesilva]
MNPEARVLIVEAVLSDEELEAAVQAHRVRWRYEGPVAIVGTRPKMDAATWEATCWRAGS